MNQSFQVQAGRVRRAFSLVELLVVLAIIGILVAVLLPMIATVRQEAYKATCGSNMRSIGVAMLCFVNDHDRKLPNMTYLTVSNFGEPNAPENFLAPMAKYMENDIKRLACPAVPVRQVQLGPFGIPTPLSDTNYVANGVALGAPLRQVHRPSQIVWLQELNERNNTAGTRPAPYYPLNKEYGLWHDSQYYASGGETVGIAHNLYKNLGGNFLFIDGHVEYRLGPGVTSGDFGLVPDEAWSPTNSFGPDHGGGGPGGGYTAKL